MDILVGIIALIISSKIVDLLKLYERVNSPEKVERVHMVLTIVLFIAIGLIIVLYRDVYDGW